MSVPGSHMDLRCPSCGWGLVCGEEEIARWLRGAGMLRRDPDASLAEMHELLRAVAPRSACPSCGRTGLVAEESPDEAAGWDQTPQCELCDRPIPAERMEALPGVTWCAACQRAEEAGTSRQAVEYCPRCGTPMVLRPARTAGITRYRMICGQWPTCRGTT
jgi:hypothetical protein